jgi:hypothetical protein
MNKKSQAKKSIVVIIGILFFGLFAFVSFVYATEWNTNSQVDLVNAWGQDDLSKI